MKNKSKRYSIFNKIRTIETEQMTEWKTYNLGEIAEIKYGKDHKKLDDGKIPVYGSGGIMRYADGFLYDNESILIPRKGTLSNLFYVNEPFWSVDTMFYTKISKRVDAKYLYYYLKNQDLASLNVGSAVPSLTTKVLNQFKVSIPSLPTQRKIAQILTSLDDKIELNLQMNQTLEAMAQAVFKEWFVEFNFPGFDGKLVDGLPKGWKMGSIYELLDVTYGYPFKSKLFNSENKGIGLIRIRDLKNNYCGYYTEEKANEKYLIKTGDIVAGMDAEFIPSIWLGEKSWLNQRLCKFSSKNKNVSELYIYYAVKPLLERSQYGKVGTTVIHLGKSDIDRYEILIPSDDILMKYKEISQELHSKIINNQRQIKTLTQTRDALLPKLMSGKIIV